MKGRYWTKEPRTPRPPPLKTNLKTQKTMYSRTDKIRHFNTLRKPSAAQKDFELLKKNNPSLSRLARYGRNPERYADDILYDLLDCSTAEDIEANRGTSTNDAKGSAVKGKTNRGGGSKKAAGNSKRTSSRKKKDTKAVGQKDTGQKSTKNPKQEHVATISESSETTTVDGAQGEDAKKK